MPRKAVEITLLLLVLSVISAKPAFAHILTGATVTASCTGYSIEVTGADFVPSDLPATIQYQIFGFPGGTISGSVPVQINASGSFDITQSAVAGPFSGTFTLSGTAQLFDTGGPQNTVAINFPTATFVCGTPTGKSFSIGPSSMEGNLFIQPGDWISGGYSFSFVSNTHPATDYTVTAMVTVPVTCPKGGGSGGNIVVDLGTKTYSVPAGNTSWLPTGDANSILSWQGAAQAPDLCGGNVMNNQHGAIFSTTVSQAPPAGLVNWRFKYRDPNAKGKGNVNCTDASDPKRNDAATCGASWSQTVRDP